MNISTFLSNALIGGILASSLLACGGLDSMSPLSADEAAIGSFSGSVESSRRVGTATKALRRSVDNLPQKSVLAIKATVTIAGLSLSQTRSKQMLRERCLRWVRFRADTGRTGARRCGKPIWTSSSVVTKLLVAKELGLETCCTRSLLG